MAVVSLMPGPVKRFLMRVLSNAYIEPGVSIGFGALIDVSELRIGRGARIGRFARITAQRAAIGPSARIGSGAVLCAHTVDLRARSIVDDGARVVGDVRDPRSVIEMGMHSWIFEGCYINVSRAVKLGRNVGVGGRSLIFTHGYWLSALKGYPIGFGDVLIGNDVWIPWSCFIMPGVVIGDGVVMGARSLVLKSVPAGALVAGSPAKILREQVANPVPLEQQWDLLTGSLEDFARQNALAFTRRDEPGIRVLTCGVEKPIVLVERFNPREHSRADASLVIVWSDVPHDALYTQPLLSLEDYSCSPVGLLSDYVMAWLQSARLLGLRFYPIDEQAWQ